MANDVKWIKMRVGMFDGMSFKKIKRAKIGGESFRDKLTAVWFELMDFAGKCNHDGAFISPSEIPFTDLADIATMIDRDEEELELCMSFFIREGMVSVIDDVYSLSNWAEYQNKDSLDKIREQNRLRVARHREKQKLLASNVIGNVTVTQSNAIDIDKEKEKEKRNKNIEDINNIAESDDSEPPAKNAERKPSKPQKHKYGEYNNVLLTDDELQKLKTEYSDWNDRIERLSSYVASTGKSYKSHYATIRNWARKDSEKTQQVKQPKETGKSKGNVFLGLLEDEM